MIVHDTSGRKPKASSNEIATRRQDIIVAFLTNRLAFVRLLEDSPVALASLLHGLL
jgi:hypothetical protein